MTARPRPRALTATALAVALLAAVAVGCAPPMDPARSAAATSAHSRLAAGGASGPSGAAGAALPPVVDRVRTHDKVVFLTYDDGAERDPRFVELVRERRLPVSMFLTDSVVGPGYGHFARLREVGANVQNHTLDHQTLRGLPYAGQRAEICGQQDKLRERFGIRPRLFRPPHGLYDPTTLRAAADCGVSAVVLWTKGASLRPGAIVLVGPPQVEETLRLLREVRERGLRVARLEDYL
ncbi:polysaccharide deacetylase family protein [Streptomyces geranii]|uniref:polysaccharide deacetylase family protein n=1 Tax=Streptomyces geranii TaxID=2058923 RepID=UPI000D026318|nr:polysaccharide deacetylase family protein [Streptomyces geranii]